MTKDIKDPCELQFQTARGTYRVYAHGVCGETVNDEFITSLSYGVLKPTGPALGTTVLFQKHKGDTLDSLQNRLHGLVTDEENRLDLLEKSWNGTRKF